MQIKMMGVCLGGADKEKLINKTDYVGVAVVLVAVL